MMALKSLGVALMLGYTMTAGAYTCDKRENQYLACVACPVNDTESNAFRKISLDCNQCAIRCGNNPRASEKLKSNTASCGYFPAGTNSTSVMNLTPNQLEDISRINPYVAVALVYAQLGDVGERTPFGGRTAFGASLTTDQAIRAISDVKSLERGRSRFDAGYAVVVEESFEVHADDSVSRRFVTSYKRATGDAVSIFDPIVLEVDPIRTLPESLSFPEIKIVEFGLTAVRIEKLPRRTGE